MMVMRSACGGEAGRGTLQFCAIASAAATARQRARIERAFFMCHLSQRVLTSLVSPFALVAVSVVLERLTAQPPAAITAVLPTGVHWHLALAVTVTVHFEGEAPSSVHVWS